MKAKQKEEDVIFSYAFPSIEAMEEFKVLLEGMYNWNLEGGRQGLVDRFYTAFVVTLDNADTDNDAICLLGDDECENRAAHRCPSCGQTFCFEHHETGDHNCKFTNGAVH